MVNSRVAASWMATFNHDKTSLGETGCLGNPCILLTGCLGIQFFYSHLPQHLTVQHLYELQETMLFHWSSSASNPTLI